MAELINLNKRRKQRARAEAETQAATNRVKFGRTKAQKQQDAAAETEAARRMDGLRREAAVPPVDPSDD